MTAVEQALEGIALKLTSEQRPYLDEVGLDPRSVPDTERWEAKSPRRNARAPVSEPRGDALAERGPRSSSVHHTARSSANAFSISICKGISIFNKLQ